MTEQVVGAPMADLTAFRCLQSFGWVLSSARTTGAVESLKLRRKQALSSMLESSQDKDRHFTQTLTIKNI